MKKTGKEQKSLNEMGKTTWNFVLLQPNSELYGKEETKETAGAAISLETKND